MIKFDLNLFLFLTVCIVTPVMTPTYGSILGKKGVFLLIDTIVLNSPFLDKNCAIKIEEISVQRSGIDFELGELMYRFTTKELKGTYDSSIRVNIKRERFVNVKDMRTLKKVTIKEDCDPYLQVECSLHKFFLGHNIYGGSDDVKKQVLFLVLFLEEQFNISLPFYEDWIISRIDYARVYNLGENINNFFEGFSQVYYPRRQVQKYGNTGLYFPGTYTTLKLYNKHEEFKKHDSKKLKKILSPTKLKELRDTSKGILRIELEVKSRKLRDIYNELPLVKDIKIEDIKNQFNVEILRIFKVSEKNMRIYNNSSDVENILREKYGNQGNIYLGTWYRLSVNGYENVKKTMSESSFYRHISKLKDAGVSWNHTDIVKCENKVIEFVFNPLNTDLEIKDDLIFKIAN